MATASNRQPRRIFHARQRDPRIDRIDTRQVHQARLHEPIVGTDAFGDEDKHEMLVAGHGIAFEDMIDQVDRAFEFDQRLLVLPLQRQFDDDRDAEAVRSRAAEAFRHLVRSYGPPAA